MIGFSGKRHSGKDTAADFFVDCGYTKRAFAHPLKKGVQELFGFSDEQLYTNKKEDIDVNWCISPRDAFQFMGTDVVRKMFPLLLPDIGEDFWVCSAKKWYDNNVDGHKGLVVWSDVRFQNEVDFILNNGGKVFKIERPQLKKIDEKVDKHLSEVSVEDIKNFTGTIFNDGTIEDFYEKLNKIIK